MIQHAMTQKKKSELSLKKLLPILQAFFGCVFWAGQQICGQEPSRSSRYTLTEFKFLRGPAGQRNLFRPSPQKLPAEHFASCSITACSFALHDLAVVGGRRLPCLLQVLQIFTMIFMGFPPKNIIRSYKIHMKLDQHVKRESEITHRKSQAPDHFKKLENES